MRLREQSVRKNHKQRNFDPNKFRSPAPSARLTGEERERMPRIQHDLSQRGITVQRWELEALARGAKIKLDGKLISYPVADEWPGFSNQMEIEKNGYDGKTVNQRVKEDAPQRPGCMARS